MSAVLDSWLVREQAQLSRNTRARGRSSRPVSVTTSTGLRLRAAAQLAQTPLLMRVQTRVRNRWYLESNSVGRNSFARTSGGG